MQGAGCRVQGAGCRVQVWPPRLLRRSWCRGWGSGFRVQGSVFSVQGSGFRVQVSGFDEGVTEALIERGVHERRSALNPKP